MLITDQVATAPCTDRVQAGHLTFEANPPGGAKKCTSGNKSTPVQQNRMKAKNTTSAARHVAPLKRSPDPQPQFKPQVVQSKSRAVTPVTSVGREGKSSPAAPLAYRPQPVPKVLQLKRHEVKKLGGIAKPQNAVRSPFIPPAPQKILQKSAGLDRAAQSPAHVKPPCVQAKTSSSLRNNPFAWSIRKALFGNVVRPGRSIQLSKAAVAPMEVESDDEAEVESKVEAKKSSGLTAKAKKLHEAIGGTNHNTTGVAKLTNGKLVACTQLSKAQLQAEAKSEGITEVTKTKGAGYHVEVSLFIDYGDLIEAIGASQDFCPHCYVFLQAKGIDMDGKVRDAVDQVWYSPEYYHRKEKKKGAPYPWAFMLIQPESTRKIFDTKDAYAKWFKQRTGAKLPW